MNPFISFNRELERHPVFPDDLFAFAWLEGNMKAEIGKIEDLKDWHEIIKWPSGRLFGDTGEYRWQTRGKNKIHAVLILDEDGPPMEFQKNRLEIQTELDWISELILYGAWINPDKDPGGNPEKKPLFFAPEIPKMHLAYPLEMDRALLESAAKEGKTPRLVVRRYCHHDEKRPDKSQGDFIRCVGFSMKKDTGMEAIDD